MKKNAWRLFLGAVVMLLLGTPIIAQAQVSIIVAKGSTHRVSKEEAKNIFAGAAVAWESGSKIQVIDQSDTETGKTFYENFLGKSANQVRLQWTKLVLSGQAIGPKKLSDDEAVRNAVSGDPNAIGYISTSALDGSVKEVARIQ